MNEKYIKTLLDKADALMPEVKKVMNGCITENDEEVILDFCGEVSNLIGYIHALKSQTKSREV
jgi:hypothetical protein